MFENDESPFRPVARTGVIFVTTEARRQGFGSDGAWSNLGQGMPETGAIAGAPDRIDTLAINEADLEYAPVQGIDELREQVASFYNHFYRKGLPSQYTAANVAICGGGRSSLTRLAAALGKVNLGHFLPDYTAYEELLDLFRLFSPIPIVLDRERGYNFSVEELRKEILGRGLGAILASNPCNPTGKVIGGEALEAWVSCARELECALIMDEFYSHYIWRPDLVANGGMNSAAAYVEDVNRDPVVILDGLTKNWRYPGLRVTWIVGPERVIEAVTSSGSFLDGGGCRPIQRAAIPLLEPDAVVAESAAIREHFAGKRQRLLDALRDMGFLIDAPPEGTFYVWASAEHLPESLSSGMSFFREALKRKVIVVPGEFFDVDPGKRRGRRFSRFTHHLRFSFGPPQASIDQALERLSEMIHDASTSA